MTIHLKKRNLSKGQTLVEFAVVSLIFIFMIVLTFNAVIAFSVQQYFSYATFMAARAYQSASNTPAEQAQRARIVLDNLIPGFAGLSPGALSGSGGSPGFAVRFPSFRKNVAFITEFSIPLPSSGDYGHFGQSSTAQPPQISIKFSVPFAELPIGNQIKERFGFLKLQAQSFLGRDVSREECQFFFKAFLSAYSLGGSAPQKSRNAFQKIVLESSDAMDDNGC